MRIYMRRLRHLNKTRSFYWFIGLGILFPTMLWASSVTISWQANTEVDMAGYKIYYGIQPGVYSVIIDAGNVTSYPIENLTAGVTYYFTLTAYDQSGNESGYALEVPFMVEDTDPPVVSSVTCQAIDGVLVRYNEEVDPISTQLAVNYSISGGIVVQSAVIQPDSQSVYLHTTQHVNGTYTLTINNVRDRADIPNIIDSDTQVNYSWNGSDATSPTVVSIEAYRNDIIAVEFSEPLDQQSAVDTANYTITPTVAILSAGLDGSFSKVFLTTAPHVAGQTYTLTINNVKDGATPGNIIVPNTRVNYVCQSEDSDPPDLIAARLNSTTELELEFGENLDQTTAG